MNDKRTLFFMGMIYIAIIGSYIAFDLAYDDKFELIKSGDVSILGSAFSMVLLWVGMFVILFERYKVVLK